MDRHRRRLDPSGEAGVAEHLETCEACRRADRAEELTEDLLARAPMHRAPEALVRLLRERAPGPRRAHRSTLILAAAAIALLAAIVVLVRGGRDRPSQVAEARIVNEAVNDHLRILYAEHPLDVPSGGIHQVKPWFAGKLDFAPIVRFEGDADFTLEGGAVAFVVDRKAAAFVWKRRLHMASLFVLRPEGLAWPAPNEQAGKLRAHVESSRGFSTVLWTDGELGYALVSDIDRAELLVLARKIAEGP